MLDTAGSCLQRSVCVTARKEAAGSVAPACATTRRTRTTAAASQNNNGLGQAYQPHSKATRTATNPPPQLGAGSATGSLSNS